MIHFFPIKTGKQKENFPLIECMLESIKKNRLSLKNGDILAISSKFVALSQNRIVKISSIVPTTKAKKLAAKMKMSPNFVQIILNESDAILGGVYGFLLAVKDNMIAPNAGIDKSNIYPGYAILYPENAFETAEEIRKKIFEKTKKKVGIIITDSRLMPTRIGTTGVAVSCSGFEPVQNCIGWKDLFGNTLKFTKRALADNIAAGSELLMGEAAEATPIILVRSNPAPWKYTERKIKKYEMRIDWKKDIYIAGLSRQRLV